MSLNKYNSELYVKGSPLTISSAHLDLLLSGALKLISVAYIESAVNTANQVKASLPSTWRLYITLRDLISFSNVKDAYDIYKSIKSIEDVFTQVYDITTNGLQKQANFFNDKYHIPGAIREVLKAISREIRTLDAAIQHLDTLTVKIAEVFESTDIAIAKSLSNQYLPEGQMTDVQELAFSNNTTYIKELDILDGIDVITRIETIVHDVVTEIQSTLHTFTDKLQYSYEKLYTSLDDIEIVLNYGSVLAEIDTYSGTVTTSFKDSFREQSSGEIKAILRGPLNTITNNVPVEQVLNAIPAVRGITANIESFMNDIHAYLLPSVESLVYDKTGLGEIRDTLILNSQVLLRMKTEIDSAYAQLDSVVEFAAKDGLQELVRELGLRISALYNLHCDVFDDAKQGSKGGFGRQSI